MDNKFKLLTAELGEERVKLKEQLSDYTFSKLGGPADYLFVATNQRELIRALDLATELKIPFFMLGSGTKMMISDSGFRGLVIKNRTGALKIGGIKGKVSTLGIGVEEATIEADSGVSIEKLNQFLTEQNLQNFQGASSPHSSLGGSIFLDPYLQAMAAKIKVWEDGNVFETSPRDLKRNNQMVISIFLKFKAV